MTPQKSWYESKTVWAFIGAVIPLVIATVNAYVEMVPKWAAPLLGLVTGVLTLVGVLSARQAGVQSAVDVANHGKDALKESDIERRAGE